MPAFARRLLFGSPRARALISDSAPETPPRGARATHYNTPYMEDAYGRRPMPGFS